ncbi:unnamed protein product, partial [Durusdinium trenchii]
GRSARESGPKSTGSGEDEKARQERERLRSQKQEEEMPDLQLYWQAEALYKKLPKKFDLSSWAAEK